MFGFTNIFLWITHDTTRSDRRHYSYFPLHPQYNREDCRRSLCLSFFKFINADGFCLGVIPIQRMFESIAVIITMFHPKTDGLI